MMKEIKTQEEAKEVLIEYLKQTIDLVENAVEIPEGDYTLDFIRNKEKKVIGHTVNIKMTLMGFKNGRKE